MTRTTSAGAAEDDMDLGVVFRALADEHRRTVIRELAADESDGERLCQSFDLPVTKQTRTYHFRTLRDAGLIRDVDYGNKKGITLRRADIDRRFPGLLDLLVAEFSGATR